MQKSRRMQTFLDWAKRNMTLIIIIACVVAISTILIVAGVAGNQHAVVPPPIIDDDNDPVVKPTEIWAAPLATYTIGMDFSAVDFIYNQTLDICEMHKAIDFKVDKASDVLSVADGVVKSIVTAADMGTTIVITHAEGIEATYSSLAETVSVIAGQAVKKGDKVGVTSDVGYYEFMEGSHLHFSMTKDGVTINPKEVIKSI